MNKPIGGYFELELPRKKREYHSNALRLNSGRNAFEYILIAKGYRKVFLPYYTCEALIEPIKKLGLQYELYYIDLTLRPIFDYSLIKPHDGFVYINYFGICDIQVLEITAKCKNLIIDNSQAFFSKPLGKVDTFYSPRKFFGIPDGGYLYTDKILDIKLEKDTSHKRMGHLLGRLDIGAEAFYQSYKKNSSELIDMPIREMSNITKRLLQSIDYVFIAQKRHKNFSYIHSILNKTNLLRINLEKNIVPMIYPYLINDGSILKKILIKNKVYIATYWPNVLKIIPSESIEHQITNDIVSIPIDQRYTKKELSRILKLIYSEGYY